MLTNRNQYYPQQIITSCSLVLILIVSLLLLTSCQPDDGQVVQASAPAIQNKGSDTIVNLALAWAERYQALHPDVGIAVTGGGSGTGIAALINGTVDIANASRQIKDKETESALANGITPIEHVIARDAIAVIVHPSNPVDALSLDKSLISTAGRLRIGPRLVVKIVPLFYYHENPTPAHMFISWKKSFDWEIKKALYCFLLTHLLLPSSEGIGVEVRQNPNAIGYDGLGYVTDDMKTVAVSASPDSAAIQPTVETVNSGEYPIARDLYMYTNGEPEGQVKTYMEWILGPEAQQIVLDLGFVPVITLTDESQQ